MKNHTFSNIFVFTVSFLKTSNKRDQIQRIFVSSIGFGQKSLCRRQLVGMRIKRNGIHPDVFKDKIQGIHQSNTSYLF